MTTVPGAWRIGTTIRGKYKIDGMLGEGGMAIVYAATHRNNKRFAVKILHPELSIHEEIANRFLKEGYVANTVNHPGAVAVVDDDVAEDGAAFLVMELLSGAPLDTLWRRYGKALPIGVTLAIGYELLDVLAAAHKKDIVHRDLKPANLFITEDGALKVLDFGIARLREATKGNVQATSSGMMLGTPAYMPPEQAMAKSSEMDNRTDLWAVGATLFTLLSGELVHVAENPTMLVIAAATEHARSLRTVMPDAPEKLVALTDKALSYDKAKRFQSAEEMQAAIAELHAELFGGVLPKQAEELLADFLRLAPPSQRGAVPSHHEVTALEPGGTTNQPVSSDLRAAAVEAPPAAVSGKSLDAPANTAEPAAAPKKQSGLTVAMGAGMTGSAGASLDAAEPPAPDAVARSLDERVQPRAAPARPAETAPAAGRGMKLVAAFALAGIGVGLAGALYSRAGTTTTPVTAESSAPSSAPSVPTLVQRPREPASAEPQQIIAPREDSVTVVVEPAGVSVEIDGRPTPVVDGGVEIRGVIGSAHHVRIVEKWQETIAEVGITARGPVPSRLHADPLRPRPKGAPSVLPASSAKPRDPALDGKFE